MRDFSPSPLDITYAVVALKATIPRKSSASPPVTCRRFQVSPSSVDFRITPFEPEAHTTHAETPFALDAGATLTPRRFVSIPLVCTFHHRASRGALKSNKTRRKRITRILAGACTFSEKARGDLQSLAWSGRRICSVRLHEPASLTPPRSRASYETFVS